MADVATDVHVTDSVRMMSALIFAGAAGEMVDRICGRILRELSAGRHPGMSIAALSEAATRLQYASLLLAGDDGACSSWEEGHSL